MEETSQPVVAPSKDAVLIEPFTGIATTSDDSVGEYLNTRLAPVQESGFNSPELKTVTETGYVNGMPVPIDLITIDGFKVNKNTGLDYLVMRAFAKKDGLILSIVSAFRSQSEQIAIYNKRYFSNGELTPLGKTAGPADKPGYSNHQSGSAIDIAVGLTVADLALGRTTAIFSWLQDNASKFGFVNNVPSEAWHWTHTQSVFVSEMLAQTLPRSPFDTSILDVLTQKALVGGSLSKSQYDKVQARNRSIQMASSDRALLFSNKTREAVYDSSDLKNKQAQQIQLQQAALTSAPVVAVGTLNPVTYNFVTGLWGDGKKV